MNNKSLSIIKIVLLTIVALLLTAILIVLLTKSRFNLINTSKVDLLYNDQASISISNIEVNATISDVIITTTPEDYISYKVYGKSKEKVEVTKTNDTLKITDNDKYMCFGICLYESIRIEISVPETQLGNLLINTKTGDIKVLDNINMTSTLTTTTGDIKVSNIPNLTINTNTGDIEVNETSTTTISSKTGEIEINNIKEKCKIKTSTGDVEIGTITLTSNSTISTKTGEVEIKRPNNIYINTITKTGEVNVYNNNRKAPYELLITTKTGDIDASAYDD